MGNGYGGGANGGGESGMPGGSPPGTEFAGSSGSSGGLMGFNKAVPISTEKKTIAYSSTTNKVFNIATADADDTLTSRMPQGVSIYNNGRVPVFLTLGYQPWTTDTAVTADADYFHILLGPGQTHIPPMRAVISTDAVKNIFDGTVLTNEVPSSNLYLDSEADVKNNTLSNTTDPVNFGVVNSGANSKQIRVGDILQVENEILECIGTYEDDPTDSSLVAGDIRCKRGMYGSTTASHADTPDVRFPFFNLYHLYDSFTDVQSDHSGSYWSKNLFGQARSNLTVSGIIPGSVNMKLYERGYQDMLTGGFATHSGDSGLTASTDYEFTIGCDGGATVDITFNTGTNVSFGSVIKLIQAQFDAKYYVAGGLKQKRVSIGIVSGNIRVWSNQRLSTGAIRLTEMSGTASANLWESGLFPAAPVAVDAVDAKLPDDVIYDPNTWTTKPNSNQICYDDGNGNLRGGGITGKVNYETGELKIKTAPNSQWVYSALVNSAFAGKLTESETSRINSLIDIYANTPSQFENAEIIIRSY